MYEATVRSRVILEVGSMVSREIGPTNLNPKNSDSPTHSLSYSPSYSFNNSVSACHVPGSGLDAGLKQELRQPESLLSRSCQSDLLPQNKLDRGIFPGKLENNSVCLIYRRRII